MSFPLPGATGPSSSSTMENGSSISLKGAEGRPASFTLNRNFGSMNALHARSSDLLVRSRAPFSAEEPAIMESKAGDTHDSQTSASDHDGSTAPTTKRSPRISDGTLEKFDFLRKREHKPNPRRARRNSITTTKAEKVMASLVQYSRGYADTGKHGDGKARAQR